MLLASSKLHIEMMYDKCLNYGHFVKIKIITIHFTLLKVSIRQQLILR